MPDGVVAAAEIAVPVVPAEVQVPAVNQQTGANAEANATGNPIQETSKKKGLENPNDKRNEADKQSLDKKENAQLIRQLGDEMNKISIPSAELSFVYQQYLNVLKEGGDRLKAYESVGAQLVVDAKDSKNNLTPEQKQSKTALGLDMQIEGLSMQHKNLKEKGEKSKTDEDRIFFIVKANELEAKITKLTGERNNILLPNQAEKALSLDKKIEDLQKQKELLEQQKKKASTTEEKIQLGESLINLDGEINELTGNRNKLVFPNQLSEFAQLFGISEADSKSLPLTQVEQYIDYAKHDRKFRKGLITSLRNNKLLQSDEGTQFINNCEKYLNSQVTKEVVEKGANTGLKLSIGALLMGFFMIYSSSKEKQGMR